MAAKLPNALLAASAGAILLFAVGATPTIASGARRPTQLTSASRGASGRTASAEQSAQPAPLAWIRNLQRDLRKLHFYSGPITGIYTPPTRAAVLRFQKAAHLVADGLWGSKSQAALDKMLHRHP